MFGLERDESGVTAAQTVVVLVIVCILVYLAIPVWGRLVERAKARSCQENQRTIHEAIAMARADGNAGSCVGYFDSVLEPGRGWGQVLIPEYLSKAPTCPVSGAAYNVSPFGIIWSDQGAGQYMWINQGLENDHRLSGQ